MQQIVDLLHYNSRMPEEKHNLFMIMLQLCYKQIISVAQKYIFVMEIRIVTAKKGIINPKVQLNIINAQHYTLESKVPVGL